MKTVKNIKRYLIGILMLMPLAALADGEQRDIKGATWVKPVEYLEIDKVKLRPVTAFSAPSTYLFGVFDINELAKAKDVQIMGMKLKPKFMRVEKITFLGRTDSEYQAFEESDYIGHVNSESFCIYTDKGIDRNYKVDYRYSSYGYVHSSSVIKDLRLVQTDQGLGFHYGWNCTYTNEGEYVTSLVVTGSTSSDIDGDGYPDRLPAFEEGEKTPYHFEGSISKPAKVEMNPVASFLFIQSSNCVTLVLFIPDAKKENYYGKEGGDLTAVRPFIIFEVEEILVADPGTVKTESIHSTSSNDRQGGITQLLGGLLTWLRGEGDPLGLGEHTDATESAVVGTVGTLLALLLGGLAGSTGGAIPLVPPVSSTIPPTGPASPIDPTKYTPSNYPDYCEKFITKQPDGDVVMRSPATGQSVHYYSNGDGTWFSDSGMTYTAQDIEERLRYEAENAGYVQQNAETAARNVAEQRAAWEAQNKRDLARGYSDEMKEYADWKREQENQVRHEEYLEKMSWKYHVPPTDAAIMNAIRHEQAMNQIEADTYIDYAKQCDQFIKTLETVDKCCDFSVNIMAAIVPGSSAVKNVYTFAKSTLVAASESIAEGKDLGEGAAHVLMGMADGALGVIQNQAGDLAGNGKMALAKEWGINVLTEDLKEGMSVIADSETWKEGFASGMDKLGRTFISTMGQKTAEFGAGKAVSGVLGGLKNKATATLKGEKGWIPIPDSLAKKLDSLLNKTHSKGIGKRADVWKVKVNDINLTEPVKSLGKIGSVKAGQGFSKFYTGVVDTKQLTENVINETSSLFGLTDKIGKAGSNVANWINDKSIDPIVTVNKNAGAIEKAFADYGATCNRIDVWATNYKKG